jgi:hypothetical protein
MLNLILRPIVLAAAVLAGWFVAREAANFGTSQIAVAHWVEK